MFSYKYRTTKGDHDGIRTAAADQNRVHTALTRGHGYCTCTAVPGHNRIRAALYRGPALYFYRTELGPGTKGYRTNAGLRVNTRTAVTEQNRIRTALYRGGRTVYSRH